jgi:general secretion pathway protein D
MSGVLGIQSVPILNKLFSARQKTSDEFEILISITPHLVRAPKLTGVDFASSMAGTQERVSVPGARPRLFGPEETLPPPVPAPTPAPAPAAPESPAAPRPEQDLEAEAGAGAPAPAPAARPVSVTWSPPEVVATLGETATLSVVAIGASGVTAAELVFRFDAGMLEVTDVGPGTLLTLDGTPLNIERNLEPGRVRVRLSRPSGASGAGAVATLTLRGLLAGAANVTIESFVLTTESGPVQAAPPGPVSVTVRP